MSRTPVSAGPPPASISPTSPPLDLDKARDAIVLHWREVDRLTFDQIAAKLGLRAKSAAYDRYQAARRRRQLSPKLLEQRAHVADGLLQTIGLLEAALFGIDVPPDMRLPVMDDKDLVDQLVKTYMRLAQVLGLKAPKQIDLNVVEVNEQGSSQADEFLLRLAAWARATRAVNPGGYEPALPPGITRPVSNVKNGSGATFSPEGPSMWSLAVDYPSTDEDE